MEKIEMRGGARIGVFNVSWPLATFTATKNEINLKASLVKTFSLKHDDVVSIRAYGNIPLIGRGIKITHNKEEYNSKIIFWVFGNRNKVLDNLSAMGYNIAKS